MRQPDLIKANAGARIDDRGLDPEGEVFYSRNSRTRVAPLLVFERDDLAVCLRALSSLLRDLGILSTRADARMLANADLQADLSRLTAAFDSARSMRAFQAVDRALGALERNAGPKIVADWLVLQL